MKRLAVYADGTWNVPSNNTNVWRMKLLTADHDLPVEQRIFYHRGIGTESTNRIRGALGKGVNANVRACYEWLVEQYSPGDQVFIFGFSRGAFIARSLAGFIERCGLLRPGCPLTVQEAFEKYRTPSVGAKSSHADAAVDSWPIYTDRALLRHSRPVPIEFLGLWDTVRYHDVPIGAVRGISRSQNLFHAIQPTVAKHVCHALAIDEHRSAYKPELIRLNEPTVASVTLEQRWFVGAHSNVGGGYRDDTLAILPLAWMQQRAGEHGLQFKETVMLHGDEHLGPVVDSFGTFLGGTYRALRRNRRHLRPIGDPVVRASQEGIDADGVRHVIDGSVFERWRASDDYHPQNITSWAHRRGLNPVDCMGDVAV